MVLGNLSFQGRDLCLRLGMLVGQRDVTVGDMTVQGLGLGLRLSPDDLEGGLLPVDLSAQGFGLCLGGIAFGRRIQRGVHQFQKQRCGSIELGTDPVEPVIIPGILARLCPAFQHLQRVAHPD